MNRSSREGIIMRGLLLFFVLLFPVIGSAQTLERIQAARAISVGYVPNQPPFTTGGGTKPTGYLIDLCRHVTGMLGTRLGITHLDVKYVATTSDAAFSAVSRGEMDLFCGPASATLAERERVSFSIPVYVTGIGALVRKDASPGLMRVLNGQVAHTGPTWRATINAGLANQRFVVYRGTTTEAWVRERIASLGVLAKVVTVSKYDEGVDLLAQGKADAFFGDRAVLMRYAAERGEGEPLQVIDRRFTLEPIAMAVRRGDEDFRLAVDTALSQLYSSGVYAQTYTIYFGTPSETARLLFQAYAIP
jgi:polar amino acid transport system substrate-binding protein